jgi:hypothetical protein
LAKKARNVAAQVREAVGVYPSNDSYDDRNEAYLRNENSSYEDSYRGSYESSWGSSYDSYENQIR